MWRTPKETSKYAFSKVRRRRSPRYRDGVQSHTNQKQQHHDGMRVVDDRNTTTAYQHYQNGSSPVTTTMTTQEKWSDHRLADSSSSRRATLLTPHASSMNSDSVSRGGRGGASRGGRSSGSHTRTFRRTGIQSPGHRKTTAVIQGSDMVATDELVTTGVAHAEGILTSETKVSRRGTFLHALRGEGEIDISLFQRKDESSVGLYALQPIYT